MEIHNESEVLIGNLLNSQKSRIITMPSNQPVTEAAKLMAENHVGSIITKDNDDIVGIITKGDIINRVVGRALDPGIIIVEDVMSKPVFFVSSDETLESTMLLMGQKNIERILVVENEDLSKPLGVLSTNDILKFAPGLLRIRRERLIIEALPEEANLTSSKFRGFCDDCSNYSENLTTENGYTLCADCIRSHLAEEEHDDDIM
ncbi:MAG: cyclic nucleotide-binding/CBS domain-containing protein [Candidatus Hodarchaeota archaeon]